MNLTQKCTQYKLKVENESQANRKASNMKTILNITQQQLISEIAYILGVIKDPQRQETLKQLNVITEDSVKVIYIDSGKNSCLPIVMIEINPTVPHCHLTHQIGLAIRMKLNQQLPQQWNRLLKIRIKLKDGSHNNAQQIEKLINDKQRTTAALENEQIHKFICNLMNNNRY